MWREMFSKVLKVGTLRLLQHKVRSSAGENWNLEVLGVPSIQVSCAIILLCQRAYSGTQSTSNIKLINIYNCYVKKGKVHSLYRH
jgi:hypothetical protein